MAAAELPGDCGTVPLSPSETPGADAENVNISAPSPSGVRSLPLSAKSSVSSSSVSSSLSSPSPSPPATSKVSLKSASPRPLPLPKALLTSKLSPPPSVSRAPLADSSHAPLSLPPPSAPLSSSLLPTQSSAVQPISPSSVSDALSSTNRQGTQPTQLTGVWLIDSLNSFLDSVIAAANGNKQSRVGSVDAQIDDGDTSKPPTSYIPVPLPASASDSDEAPVEPFFDLNDLSLSLRIPSFFFLPQRLRERIFSSCPDGSTCLRDNEKDELYYRASIPRSPCDCSPLSCRWQGPPTAPGEYENQLDLISRTTDNPFGNERIPLPDFNVPSSGNGKFNYHRHNQYRYNRHENTDVLLDFENAYADIPSQFDPWTRNSASCRIGNSANIVDEISGAASSLFDWCGGVDGIRTSCEDFPTSPIDPILCPSPPASIKEAAAGCVNRLPKMPLQGDGQQYQPEIDDFLTDHPYSTAGESHRHRRRLSEQFPSSFMLWRRYWAATKGWLKKRTRKSDASFNKHYQKTEEWFFSLPYNLQILFAMHAGAEEGAGPDGIVMNDYEADDDAKHFLPHRYRPASRDRMIDGDMSHRLHTGVHDSKSSIGELLAQGILPGVCGNGDIGVPRIFDLLSGCHSSNARSRGKRGDTFVGTKKKASRRCNSSSPRRSPVPLALQNRGREGRTDKEVEIIVKGMKCDLNLGTNENLVEIDQATYDHIARNHQSILHELRQEEEKRQQHGHLLHDLQDPPYHQPSVVTTMVSDLSASARPPLATHPDSLFAPPSLHQKLPLQSRDDHHSPGSYFPIISQQHQADTGSAPPQQYAHYLQTQLPPSLSQADGIHKSVLMKDDEAQIGISRPGKPISRLSNFIHIDGGRRKKYQNTNQNLNEGNQTIERYLNPLATEDSNFSDTFHDRPSTGRLMIPSLAPSRGDQTSRYPGMELVTENPSSFFPPSSSLPSIYVPSPSSSSSSAHRDERPKLCWTTQYEMPPMSPRIGDMHSCTAVTSSPLIVGGIANSISGMSGAELNDHKVIITDTPIRSDFDNTSSSRIISTTPKGRFFYRYPNEMVAKIHQAQLLKAKEKEKDKVREPLRENCGIESGRESRSDASFSNPEEAEISTRVRHSDDDNPYRAMPADIAADRFSDTPVKSSTNVEDINCAAAEDLDSSFLPDNQIERDNLVEKKSSDGRADERCRPRLEHLSEYVQHALPLHSSAESCSVGQGRGSDDANENPRDLIAKISFFSPEPSFNTSSPGSPASSPPTESARKHEKSDATLIEDLHCSPSFSMYISPRHEADENCRQGMERRGNHGVVESPSDTFSSDSGALSSRFARIGDEGYRSAEVSQSGDPSGEGHDDMACFRYDSGRRSASRFNRFGQNRNGVCWPGQLNDRNNDTTGSGRKVLKGGFSATSGAPAIDSPNLLI